MRARWQVVFSGLLAALWLASRVCAAGGVPGSRVEGPAPPLLELLAQARAAGEKGPARIVIEKVGRTLSVWLGGRRLRTYSCVFGQAPLEDKLKSGDHRTPRGHYFICNRNRASRFHLFLGLSYPSAEDAERAGREGRLGARLVQRIGAAQKARDFARWPAELWSTPLGGEVGIHGLPNGMTDGDVRHDIQRSGDWTWGCISVLNAHIEELFGALPVGTPVEIRGP